jgi:hypothetical protein
LLSSSRRFGFSGIHDVKAIQTAIGVVGGSTALMVGAAVGMGKSEAKGNYLMWLAKIAIWSGGILTFSGTNIPGRILYSLGIRPFLDYEIDQAAITIGLCILSAGVVAFAYEREKVSN